VPGIVLEGPRVLTVIGELEPASLAQHVRMDWERHLGGLSESTLIDESREAGRRSDDA
jgi:hypothetical protein